MVIGVLRACVDCGRPFHTCCLPAHCGCVRFKQWMKEAEEGKQKVQTEIVICPCDGLGTDPIIVEEKK